MMGGFSKRKRERETFVRALDKTLLFASVGKLGPWESSVNRAQGGRGRHAGGSASNERESERERESRYLLGRGRRGERREEEEKPKEKHFFDF